jgi:hypothetical protein
LILYLRPPRRILDSVETVRLQPESRQRTSRSANRDQRFTRKTLKIEAVPRPLDRDTLAPERAINFLLTEMNRRNISGLRWRKPNATACPHWCARNTADAVHSHIKGSCGEGLPAERKNCHPYCTESCRQFERETILPRLWMSTTKSPLVRSDGLTVTRSKPLLHGAQIDARPQSQREHRFASSDCSSASSLPVSDLGLPFSTAITYCLPPLR